MLNPLIASMLDPSKDNWDKQFKKRFGGTPYEEEIKAFIEILVRGITRDHENEIWEINEALEIRNTPL